MAKRKQVNSLTVHQMAKRICEREDNIYDKKIIENILNKYMDECYRQKSGKLKEPLENQTALVYNLLRSDRN